MPSLPGFSDNPLITREDAVTASIALITPLLPYFSPGCARVRIPVTIGTHFDETAAQLEGFARPLFVVGALLHAHHPSEGLLQSWIDGFVTGTDPEHPEYWGPISDKDQRMVEAEMVAFALLAAPRETLWDCFNDRTKSNMIKWLSGLQGKEIHTSNWLWFRVMSSIALIKVCGENRAIFQDQMDADLKLLDAMYLQDGWSSDGIWPDAEDVLAKEEVVFTATGKRNQRFWSRQADYYSGSFAIQFSQLLFVKFAADMDPDRAARYRQQAREFGSQFWRYFDNEGAAIPFGRSLTYRFACAGFFAAVAFAEVDALPGPLSEPGALKGYLLRHLRWWAERSDDIFYPDGTMNIGWMYPNMFLSEDYNSPQSVYWALKSFIVVALGPDHPFWTGTESKCDEGAYGGVKYLPAPRQILCNHPSSNHHFLLNPSQYLTRPFKNATAKYCKFAYSSAFTFSLTVGNIVASQLAPDNALLLSRDGTETWATKTCCTDAEVGVFSVFSRTLSTEHLTVASARWYPWANRQVSVTTTLIPPSNRWPDWHIRVHKIQIHKGSLDYLHILEGGFSIAGRRRSDGLLLPMLSPDELGPSPQLGAVEGIYQQEGDNSIAIFSSAGASGIAVESMYQGVSSDNKKPITTVTPIKSEANTNLTTVRAMMPIAEHETRDLVVGAEIFLVTKVFALSTEANGSRRISGKSVLERFLDQPQVRFSAITNQSNPGEDYIEALV